MFFDPQLNDWITLTRGGPPGNGGTPIQFVCQLRELVALLTNSSGVSSISVAGSGLSINQSTGNVVITGSGGAGGPDTIAGQSNVTGNTTIVRTSNHTIAPITFTGVARTSILVLSTFGAVAGDRLYIRTIIPATSNIVIQIRNAATGGTLLYSYTTDGTGLDLGYFDLYFDGTAWQKLDNVLPAA